MNNLQKIPVVILVMLMLFTAHVQAGEYISAGETKKILEGMGILDGQAKYVKTSSTNIDEWKVHLFTIKQNNMDMPLITYVNSRDVIIGILIRDGKVVKPTMSPEEMRPAIDMKSYKLSSDKRITFNKAEGKKTIYMFTDPDCPYCRPIEEKLPQYRGRYKVIIKHFPLVQIHPDAKRKAIERQCRWLNRSCDDVTKQLAAQLVEEDINEATAIGVSSTPFFIDKDGHVMGGIPDLR